MNRPNQPPMGTEEQREAANVIQRRVAALEASLRLNGTPTTSRTVINDALAIEAFLRGDEVTK